MSSCVCEENGKKFRLEYPDNWKCERVRIDGKILNEQYIRKCDYAFLLSDQNNKKKWLFYVELKGVDLKEAIKQLESTVKTLRDQYKDYVNNEAHAVCCRIIPHMTSSAQNSALRFKKQYDFTLKWHSKLGLVRVP